MWSKRIVGHTIRTSKSLNRFICRSRKGKRNMSVISTADRRSTAAVSVCVCVCTVRPMSKPEPSLLSVPHKWCKISSHIWIEFRSLFSCTSCVLINFNQSKCADFTLGDDFVVRARQKTHTSHPNARKEKHVYALAHTRSLAITHAHTHFAHISVPFVESPICDATCHGQNVALFARAEIALASAIKRCVLYPSVRVNEMVRVRATSSTSRNTFGRHSQLSRKKRIPSSILASRVAKRNEGKTKRNRCGHTLDHRTRKHLRFKVKRPSFQRKMANRARLIGVAFPPNCNLIMEFANNAKRQR